MCTALLDRVNGCLGRTLDLEYTYDEQVVVTPRDRFGPYGMVGTATVAQGFPLYYDGVNEMGLGMAGLHFPHSGAYPPPRDGAENVGSYQLIPTVLGRCATVAEAEALLKQVWLCDRSFSPAYPATPLHWMIADERDALVVEPTAEGLRLYRNPVGVLTNEPPFPHQVSHLAGFAHLTPDEPQGGWQTPVSRGGGAVGMPGDAGSPARFVRAAFAAAHTPPVAEEERVSHAFRLMGTVEVPRGLVRTADGRWVVTHYTCCMDLRHKVYYYRTYGCHRIRGVRCCDGTASYPLFQREDVDWGK